MENELEIMLYLITLLKDAQRNRLQILYSSKYPGVKHQGNTPEKVANPCWL